MIGNGAANFGDHIERAAIGKCIEQPFGDGANAWAPGVHRALVKGLGHEPPEPLVVGVIQAEHGGLEGFWGHTSH